MRKVILATGMVLIALWNPAYAADDNEGGGEDVEVYGGAITALSCAMDAKVSGKLDPISNCAMSETVSGYAVYDVATKDIYRLAPKSVHMYELERAFGGGSIDFEGVVAEESDGIAVVEVEDYTINPRPKPGAFKGCL